MSAPIDPVGTGTSAGRRSLVRTGNRSGRHLDGPGRVLVVIYAILAVAATARSVYQLATRFDEAPVAYSLSAVAGAVYIVATLALALPGDGWRRVAWVTIIFELVGVVAVGTASILVADIFPHDTVWSWFGRGYAFVPLVLPILGLVWLARSRPPRGSGVAR